MNLYTHGGLYYPDRWIPIKLNNCEKLDEKELIEDHFKLIIINRGTAILRIGEKRVSIISPAVLCVNEREGVLIEKGIDFNAKSFYFNPQFINSNLNFEKIRGLEENISLTDIQDCYLFTPFIERNSNYYGQLEIDVMILNRFEWLLESIGKEIIKQKDQFWPCRIRTFFIELLFTLVRMYELPKYTAKNTVETTSSDVDEIILYLNTNYYKKITIKQLCKLFNINRTTLNRQFRDATGESVITYLINLRIKIATLMLKDTKITIGEIVDKVGFGGSAHFNKSFKKHTGYSPSEYRKKFTWHQSNTGAL